MEDLVDVARLIRPYLPDLVGERQAMELDARIGEVLGLRPGDPQQDTRLRAVLSEDDAVVEWVEQVLEDPRLLPPELRKRDVRGFEPLPGKGDPVAADRFVCPVNKDVVWYRPKVGVPVPNCRTHNVQLVRS